MEFVVGGCVVIVVGTVGLYLTKAVRETCGLGLALSHTNIH